MILEQLSEYRSWCSEQAGTDSLSAIVRREQALLHQPDYLVNDVIGMGEFDWDFRCLDEGLMQLVSPYLAEPSGVAAIFSSALTALDAVTEANERGMLFVEFGHYATLINDHYTFHREFSAIDISPRKSSLLTQLRYAGQYLSNYPRYQMVNDEFSLPDRQQIDLHDALAGAAVIQGMSRGVLLTWMKRRFASLTREQYQQNAINLVHNYIAFPVVIALILAGVERRDVKSARKSLAYLSLAIKLSLERSAIASAGETKTTAPAQATESVLSFPGFSFIDDHKCFDIVPATGAASVTLAEFVESAQAAATRNRARILEFYDEHIAAVLALFALDLDRSRILKNWGSGLAAALQQRGVG